MTAPSIHGRKGLSCVRAANSQDLLRAAGMLAYVVGYIIELPTDQQPTIVAACVFGKFSGCECDRTCTRRLRRARRAEDQ